MKVKITKLPPPILDKAPERYYRAVDVVRATGFTYGCVSNYINQELNRRVKDGMTLDEIVAFLDAPHRDDPRTNSDPRNVQEIRDRMRKEKYILLEDIPLNNTTDEEA